MSIKVISNTLSLDDLRMEFRSFKLKCINNEIEFKISDSVVNENKNLLSFITDTFPNDVITGSLALKLLGLISRESNDIDILIKDKSRYDKYIIGDYKLAIFANTKVVKATGIKHNEDLTTIFGQAPWQVK